MSGKLYSVGSSSGSENSPLHEKNYHDDGLDQQYDDDNELDHDHEHELDHDESSPDDDRKRLRTKTACDYCRKRKTKCNGESPCSSCLYYKRQCIYTYVPKVRKKRVSKFSNNSSGNPAKKHNPNSLQGLNNRMSALESLLTKLITKMDGSNTFAKDLKGINKTGEEEDSDTLSLASLPSSDNESSDEHTKPQDLVLNEKAITNPSKLGEMMKTERVHQHCVLNINPRRRILQWVGSHSVFHVLSAKSIRWLRTKLNDANDEELLVPIKNLPVALNNAVDTTLKIWYAPEDDKIYNSNLYFSRDDKGLTFELLDYCYESLHIAPFLCNLNLIRELFQVYHYAISQGDFDVIQGLSLSDFLIMNVSLCLCLMNISSPIVSESYPTLSSKSLHDLNLLKQKFFKYAIHCYEKVNVVTEGIRSVQGIALLMLYIEASYITDVHINYMLACSLIRIARDVGIQRIDLYKYDKDESYTQLKRRLWWFCEYMDKEMCYKSGKSEIINQNDANALTEYDDYFVSVPVQPFKSNSYLKNSLKLITNCQYHGYQYYFVYYSLMLSRIKSKSYGLLYGARVDFMSQDDLLDNLQQVNDEMFKMAKLMEPDVRPTLYYLKKDGGRSEAVQDLFKGHEAYYNYSNLLLQMSFFSHLLTINRVPFMQPNFVSNERSIKFGNLSLESSRTILHLVNDFDKSSVPASKISYLKFYPFMAFCSLCGHIIGFPKESSVESDCELLIEVSMKFFAHKDNNRSLESWNESRLYDSKNTIFDLIARLFLKILVNLMIKESEINYLNKVVGLREHLEASAFIYPDLFKRSDGDLPLNLMFDFSKGISSDLNSKPAMQSGSDIGGLVNSLPSYSVDTPVSSVESKPFETGADKAPTDIAQAINFESLNEETFGSLLNSQAFSLPNFFYDGNIDSGAFVTNEEYDFDYFNN
ncbi:uncharacterized protein RJT21DRAFT_124609 [Scheffersomyces amazonensis]|uniref:uncharacterized protein n=1 Tax=Scheffersomyces amazonensis TaxID=1078765 RepID=UPI00315D305C